MPSILEKSKDMTIIFPYILRVFPQVEQELNIWRKQADIIPNLELRKQALDSIASKRFHCQGGSIYALYTPEFGQIVIQFIVALQTISDYLDNLSDRVAGANEASLRTLHQSILAAVDVDEPVIDWYRDYPCRDDGGYLDCLVVSCREVLIKLVGYQDVRVDIRQLMELYADLQVFKHLEFNIRKELLVCWFSRHQISFPDIYWWEFSAACGSTIGVFMLAAMAAAGPVKPEETMKMLSCYFPWLCGMHILLDYFIDMDEDNEHNDLNFINFYPTTQAMQEGLFRFLQNSLEQVKSLPRRSFHRTVMAGMLAMYLSDPKAELFGRKKISQQLLRYAGPEAVWLQRICLFLRKNGIL